MGRRQRRGAPGWVGGALGAARGASVVEALVTLALMCVIGGLCIASVSPGTRPVREETAARFLAMRVRQARQEALRRATTVGMRFEQATDGSVRFRLYADGNANGLRTRDIQDGRDPPLGPSRGLEDDFAGVAFGVAGPAPPIEPGDERLDPGADPIRVGASRMLSFSRAGRGSSGTVYVCGRGGGGQQFAVRVFGQTGRVRLLQFRAGDGQWIER